MFVVGATNTALKPASRDRLGLSDLWAVFLLQTLFVPATWAVASIVPYGSPVVNSPVHARNCRVPTEIVRCPPTSLKAPTDPQHLVISSSDGFRAMSGAFWPRFGWAIPNILCLGGRFRQSGVGSGRIQADFDDIISVIGNRAWSPALRSVPTCVGNTAMSVPSLT